MVMTISVYRCRMPASWILLHIVHILVYTYILRMDNFIQFVTPSMDFFGLYERAPRYRFIRMSTLCLPVQLTRVGDAIVHVSE